MFGVHTLDEFNHSISNLHQIVKKEKRVITLLGQIPAKLSFNLSFIHDVILYESDMNLVTDSDYLRTVFHIGDTSPVRFFRLLTPLSLEMEFILPKSILIQEYQSFLERKTNQFTNILR